VTRRRLCLLLVVGALLLVTTSSPAQTVTSTTGAVNGIVTDSSHAVVPGVTITLSGPALITPRATLTDNAGAYRFSAVPAGIHTLTFDLAGFVTIVRENIQIGLGFTATVNVEMSLGNLRDSVSVRGSPVVDVSSTAVTTHFDDDKLASLPGSRDIFSVLANTPGVAQPKMDVGGSGALALQDYTAYGLRSVLGVHRNEVEGIRVGGANGSSDNYLSDYASFAEIAITAVGHSASMPNPGIRARYVSKSGGNAFHGDLYADFQNDGMEATNIDNDQILSGVTGGPGLPARDVNKLQRFRDLTMDAGGYLKKDRAWWYGAYRSSSVTQSYPWLLDTSATLDAEVVTGKATVLLSPRHRVVGYLQREGFQQSNFFAVGASLPLQSGDALPSLDFPVRVWKGEYNATLTDAIYLEARVGGYHSDGVVTSKSAAPRIVDVGRNTVSGGAGALERLIDRPQVNGALSLQKSGWGGSHTFTIGGEFMSDRVVTTNSGYRDSCNCVSTLNNSVPTQVQIQTGTNVSKNDLTTAAGFVDDTWRVASRVTLLLGLRLDRYQPILPAQQGPTGEEFAAIDPVLTFNNWAPRVGMTADLTGDGKTVVKLHYGRFWVYPSPLFTTAFNPNPPGWSRSYAWLDDADGNGRWSPGEEGVLRSLSGGSTSTSLDPKIDNTFAHQASAYVEREVAADFGVRTGIVLIARRQPYGTINVSRPLDAYSIPVAVVDPGPDGRLGSLDDGGALTAYDLTAEALNAPPVNLTTNLPDSNSEYTTWEITATRRQNARWSLLASFTHTWTREAALGTGNDFTPNALINASGNQDRFTTWQAKLNSTVELPWGFRAVPVVRYQSGQPFARTFVRTLNYGNATIKAEPIAANRTPDILLVDVRGEKVFRVKATRVAGFVDVYNLFNANAVQTLTTSSGAFWLRPTAITGPRVFRIGARLAW
jgi:hypothetical protein